MWAEQEAGKEPRERSGSAGRKRSARGRGGRAGAGLGPPRIVQRLAGAAGPGPVWFPGMVSKGLLRLISSVNRRRMKLLLGIALLAYAACECARGGREPIHSRAAGSGRCGRPSGGLCRAGSRVPASTRLHLCSGAGGCLACSRPRVGPASDPVTGGGAFAPDAVVTFPARTVGTADSTDLVVPGSSYWPERQRCPWRPGSPLGPG